MIASLDSLLMKARQARRDRRFADAIRDFEAVLEQAPGNLAARIEGSGALIQAGRLDEAGPIVATLLRAMAQHPGVRAEAGALMRARGLHAEGLAHYEIAAECASDPTQALIAVADTARAIGRYPRALAAATAATECSPESVPAWMALAAAARDLGDTQTERLALRRAVDADSSDVTALIVLARSLAESEERVAAEAFLRNAEALVPDQVGPTIARGHLALAIGQIESALEIFQEASERDSGALAAATGILDCLIRLGRTEDATAAMAVADTHFGTRPELALQRASLFQAEGRPAEARLAFRAAMVEPSEAHHTRWEAWFHMELMLGITEDREACIAAAMPSNSAERASLARAKANAAEADYDWERARRHYTEVMAFAPDGAAMDGLARIATLHLDPGTAFGWLTRQAEAESALRRRLGRPLNPSQTKTGQIAQEFQLDRDGCDALSDILSQPPQSRIAPLITAALALPDSTAVALWLLISLRLAGRLEVSGQEVPSRIPRRLLWLLPRGTAPGSARAEGWCVRNPGIEIVEMDRDAAGQFVVERFHTVGRQAWLGARDAGDRIDLVRLAWLSDAGGWSVLPGARAVSSLDRLSAGAAEFIAGQGAWGAPMPIILGAASGSAVASTAATRVVEAMARGDSDHRWLRSGQGLLARAMAAVVSENAAPGTILRLVRPSAVLNVVQWDSSGLWNGAQF